MQAGHPPRNIHPSGTIVSSNWFVTPKPEVQPVLRLFCFPYAGGSAKTFVRWKPLLPAGVDLVAVQPPGRGTRIFEPPYQSIADFTADLLREIRPHLDVPYAFLGHSLGASMAFELLLALRAEGRPLPVHFIASGSTPPHRARSKRGAASMSDEELTAAVRSMRGTPESVLQNEELMALYLPALRGDFAIVDSCPLRPAEPLPCSLSLLGALDDELVHPEHLVAWERHFERRDTLRWFEGGHFFIDAMSHAVADTVGDILTRTSVDEVVQS
jgi:surfactin synthase thioesterase subunit